ncbi:hypothetical protein IL306_001920 [Fusarium sp. DS 682]|nr:hypothetical protein IL306_001920 [Fusarium sp. DS 682]
MNHMEVIPEVNMKPCPLIHGGPDDGPDDGSDDESSVTPDGKEDESSDSDDEPRDSWDDGDDEDTNDEDEDEPQPSIDRLRDLDILFFGKENPQRSDKNVEIRMLISSKHLYLATDLVKEEKRRASCERHFTGWDA